MLYTSGTTGQPKGCILSHEYELEIGVWYTETPGLDFREGGERLYNPLPLFHINAGIVSLLAMMLTGNRQIQPERFSASAWWDDVRASEATVVHYLGVVVAVLMAAPPDPRDRDHKVRFGAGAGVEPSLHRAFEERFGFPIVSIGYVDLC